MHFNVFTHLEDELTAHCFKNQLSEVFETKFKGIAGIVGSDNKAMQVLSLVVSWG